MFVSPLEMLWRSGLLFVALLVVPCFYFLARRRLLAAGLASPPRLELFVAFGTFGGWLLTFALLGAPMILPLLCVGFQYAVALPACLFCVARLALRPATSRFHTPLLLGLAAGVLMPFAIGALVGIFDSSPS